MDTGVSKSEKWYHKKSYGQVKDFLNSTERRLGFAEAIPETLDQGELFDAAVAQSKERGGRPPQYVVRVDVAEVWSVWPGQTGEPLTA